MQISKTLIAVLQQLINGETIPYSKLNKDMVNTLLAEGILTVKAQGSRRTVSAIDTTALREFLLSYSEEFRIALESEYSQIELNQTRSEQAYTTGNSKLVKVRSCPGFPVNTYEPIRCNLNNQDVLLNPHEGSFLFIDNWHSFSVPEDVIIVGIENMENFRMIRKQRIFFESEIGKYHFLFVSRYPQSTDLRQWLQIIPNRYVHFGDFDLAGIHIFLTEFYKYLGGRSSFLIPSNIEQRLKNGSSIRFNSQYDKFHSIHSDEQSLQSLIELIHKYHRCYDQEGYIVQQ